MSSSDYNGRGKFKVKYSLKGKHVKDEFHYDFPHRLTRAYVCLSL